jgi:hypothetical protein
VKREAKQCPVCRLPETEEGANLATAMLLGMVNPDQNLADGLCPRCGQRGHDCTIGELTDRFVQWVKSIQ